jgi:peptidoglycan hydrolase-like protein with peptidoglycan-binding domain
MIRQLALVSTLIAAVGASALSAQSTSPAPQQPAAAPAMKHTPAVHVKADTTKAAPSAKATSPTTRHAKWTKEQIEEAQEGLAKAGLYKGKATGVLNKDTKKALREYQKENKLPVTGRLSDDVLAKLKST